MGGRQRLQMTIGARVRSCNYSSSYMSVPTPSKPRSASILLYSLGIAGAEIRLHIMLLLLERGPILLLAVICSFCCKIDRR